MPVMMVEVTFDLVALLQQPMANFKSDKTKLQTMVVVSIFLVAFISVSIQSIQVGSSSVKISPTMAMVEVCT